MREKLVKVIMGVLPSCYSDVFAFQIADHLIANDVVPVVRCKDCKHSGVMEYTGKRYCKYPMGCLGCTPTESDNFCSYGERKDNDSF